MVMCQACQGKGVMVDQSPFGSSGVCTSCRGSGKLIQSIKDLLPPEHACLLYEDPQLQLPVVVSFLIEGLTQGECCFYVADEHSVETVKEAFARTGVNVKKQINNRALNILTKNESYLSSGHFNASQMLDYIKDAIKAATRAGFLAFRATGEMTWALGGEPGCDQLIPYETLLDHYVDQVKPDVTFLCQYNLKRFPDDKLQGVLHTHRYVVLEGARVVSNPYYKKMKRDYSGAQVGQMINFLKKQAASN